MAGTTGVVESKQFGRPIRHDEGRFMFWNVARDPIGSKRWLPDVFHDDRRDAVLVRAIRSPAAWRAFTRLVDHADAVVGHDHIHRSDANGSPADSTARVQVINDD